MPSDPPRATPRSLEPEVRRLWTTRRLPAKGGVIGRGDGPRLRQIEGAFLSGDPPAMVAHRAVLADVDARYLSLSGRSAIGTLRHEAGGISPPSDEIVTLLESLGIWTGGAGDHPWDESDQRTAIQAVVARLAHRGILVSRDGPLRVCITCRVPRTPERIIYQKEIGDTYLVRFPLAGTDPPVEALVWVDAPWRLLGASALLLHPDLPYVVAEYRRRGSSVTILVSRGALDRLRSWLSDAELVVREEKPGREWVGRAYAYPLRHEFPIGGSLDPPAGTIQADPSVGDSGTGIVPLVPGHGPTDAEIATRLGIAGWPLLSPRGVLDPSLMHKYAGLDVETANEFVSRDLTDGNAVLARLRVVRGVPYCAVCGHRIVWAPGRAWCLEPGNLPAEQRDRYARLLPHDRPIGQIEVSRWPVSDTLPSRDPSHPALLECARCERLDAPDGPRQCPCGGTRRPVNRRLLPAVAGAFGAWCRNEPIAPTDTVRIYENDRRRVPSLVHNLTAMAGVDAATADFGLTRVPTVSRLDVARLAERCGADAVRSAFVRTSEGDGDTANFEQRCVQEQQRLQRLLQSALDLLAQCDPPLLREGTQPPDRSARDLEPEDRAVLARWGRAHLQVFAAYDRWDAAAAHRRLFRFLEQDLVRYLQMVRPRLRLAGMPATKRAALRTLLYLTRATAVALAPIAPFTAESIHRRYLPEARSLFESTDLTADRALVDDAAAGAWDRWHGVVQSLDRFRNGRGLAPEAPLEAAVVSVADEEVAEKLRSDRTTIERLARVGRFEVASPKVPWEGRRRQVVPLEREIQRAYPALATQIVHLLQHLPPRTGAESTARSLTVFVNGAPHTITPEMVSTVDTLPENFVPTPFPLGEMFVRVPGGTRGSSDPPPLSPDAFWLVRRVAHRLATARVVDEETYRVALAVAVDPLASELREKAEPIARYLGIEEFRVEEAVEEALPPDRVTGRTRTGARWWVAVPGLRSRARPAKHRTARSDGRRVRSPTPAPPSDEVDYADEKVVARAQAIRELGQEMDTLFGTPVLGPTKILIAWEAGLQSMPQFRDAPFDQVAGLPGYGRPVVSVLWSKLGKEAPGRPHLTKVRKGGAGAPAPVSRRERPRHDRLPAEKSTGPTTVPSPSPAQNEEVPSSEAVAPAVLEPSSGAVNGTPAKEPTTATNASEATAPIVPEIAPVDSEPSASGESTPPEPSLTIEELPIQEPVVPPAPIANAPEPEVEPLAPEPIGAPPEAVPLAEGPVPELAPEPVPAPSEVAAMPSVPEEIPPLPPEPDVEHSVEGLAPPPTEASAVSAVGQSPVPVPIAPGAESLPPPAPEESGEAAPEPGPAVEEEGGTPYPPGEVAETEVQPVEPVSVPEVSAHAEVGGGSEPPVAPPVEPPSDVRPPLEGPPPTPVPLEPAPEPVPEVVPEQTEETPGDVAAPPPEAAPDIGAATAGEIAPVPGIEPPAPEPTPPAPLPSTERALLVPEVGPPAAASDERLPAVRPEHALVVPAPETPPGTPPPPPEPPVLSLPTPVLAPPTVIEPPPPVRETVPVVAPAPPPSPPSGIEFDDSPTLFGALQPFLDATAAGHRGLAIVRELPERIRTHVGPRPVDVLWLSNLERNRTLRPSDLGEIARRIERALTDEGVTVFFIEGIEYLVRIHGVDRIVEFLQSVDQTSRAHEARVWLHTTRGLLPEAELERIRREVAEGASEADGPDDAEPDDSAQ